MADKNYILLYAMADNAVNEVQNLKFVDSINSFHPTPRVKNLNFEENTKIVMYLS